MGIRDNLQKINTKGKLHEIYCLSNSQAFRNAKLREFFTQFYSTKLFSGKFMYNTVLPLQFASIFLCVADELFQVSGSVSSCPVPEFIDPRFRENKPKTLVFSHRKRAFWACFRENCVYNFGHNFRNFRRFFSCAAARATRQRAVRPVDGREPEQEVRTRLERRGGRGIQLPDHTCHVGCTLG
jgi:hypothetical protein